MEQAQIKAYLENGLVSAEALFEQASKSNATYDMAYAFGMLTGVVKVAVMEIEFAQRRAA